MFKNKAKHRTQLSLRPRRWAGQAIFVGLALTVAVCGTQSIALAGIESDPNLVKLEMKFFQHDFGKEDDVNARLGRLEKMVFGDVRTGDSNERLKNLLAAVPNLDAAPVTPSGQNSSTTAANPDDSSSSASDRGSAQSATKTARKPANPSEELAEREKDITDGSQYPAVTAIERRLLGHDYANEPIARRLERLEIKSFGHVSNNTDLSDRVDRLKAKTGIDLANSPPPGSDWADDEDRPSGGGEVTYYPTSTKPFTDGYKAGGTYGAGGGTGASSMGGYSSGGSGSYGMGGAPRRTASNGYQSGGSYGYHEPPKKIASAANPIGSGFPKPAPDVVREAQTAPAPAMGLFDTVNALENSLFGKSFHDPLPARLSRLESTVFPNQRPSTDMSMPDRVHRLTDAVPISNGAHRIADSGNNSGAVASRPSYQSPEDQAGQDPSMPKPAPQRKGFSKIIGAMGNMLNGGGSSAYPVGSNLVPDPTTGLLYDRFTGNLIDPATGVVVSNRSSATMGGASTMGMGGFNNGLSPIGTPYGMSGSSMRFGFGGGGVRFGGGGMGMGMGTGMGTGLGMWP